MFVPTPVLETFVTQFLLCLFASCCYNLITALLASKSFS